MSISSSTTRLESTLEPTATMALFAPANGNDFVEEETEDVFKGIHLRKFLRRFEVILGCYVFLLLL